MFIKILLSVCMTVTLIVPISAYADEDADRENLTRIVEELSFIRQSVTDAGKNADNNGRIRFQYDWLAQDIRLIQRGIEDHLERPRQPRARLSKCLPYEQ